MSHNADLQEAIRLKYGEDFIDKKLDELCSRCLARAGAICTDGLLPITSDGTDCPYFRRQP